MTNGRTVSWHQAEPANLVLISGPESYFASRASRLIKDKLRASHEDLEVNEVADGEYSPGLIFSLASPSLFNEPRLVIIGSASEGLAEDLEQLLLEPAENCTIVVRIPNLVGHNGKLKKQLSASALNVSCEEVKKDVDRIDFIKREFQRLETPIDQPANSGVAKVSLAEVERTFQGRVETNAFKIADAALAGNASEAIRLFRHGFATGIDSVALTAALSMKIRQLARLFNDRNAPAAATGMQPWQQDRAIKELAGWSEPQLIELVQLAAQTDFDVKGASRDPEYSIEKLLLAMAKSGQ